MTCLGQSEQCRGELFRSNERSFATFRHFDLSSASIYCKSNLLSYKCAVRYLLDCNKNQASRFFHATKSVKWIFHQLHRYRTFNVMYARY